MRGGRVDKRVDTADHTHRLRADRAAASTLAVIAAAAGFKQLVARLEAVLSMRAIQNLAGTREDNSIHGTQPEISRAHTKGPRLLSFNKKN